MNTDRDGSVTTETSVQTTTTQDITPTQTVPAAGINAKGDIVAVEQVPTSGLFTPADDSNATATQTQTTTTTTTSES